MQIAVLGATGGIGRAIVAELVDRGHHVTAASRSATPDGVTAGAEALQTDLRDPEQAQRACEGAEVVVMAAHVAYSRWRTELGPLFDRGVEASEAAGARLVVVDNLYAYGAPSGVISEATPEAATSVKGRLRAELGRRLLDAHEQGRIRVTIGRFPDYYGPHGANSLLNQLAIEPAVAGKRPRGFVDLDQPRTFSFLPDAARGFATLVEAASADGRVWVLPAAPPVTQREFIRLLSEDLGRELRPGVVTPRMLALAGLFNRELREAREVVPQFDRPYVTDASDFEERFGPVPVTEHRAGIAETVAWIRSRPVRS